MALMSLPDDVLKTLMRHVPVRDRLTSCCFVNMRLHAAAVAATDTVVLKGEDTSLCQQWLPHYGEHVTKLQLSHYSRPLLQLPCANLQELSLNLFCSVQLGQPGGQPGVVQGCKKLTRLELLCHIMDGPVVDSLSQLVHLQHLHVQPKRVTHYESTIEGLSSAVLPCLQQLTYLEVHNLSEDSLPQLGSLTRLQGLCFGVSGGITFGPSTLPGLVLPTSLTFLDVQSEVELGVLSLLPTGLVGLGLGCVVQGPTEGANLLLSGLARQQHLTGLHLNWGQELALPAAGSAYTALTASSSLASLECGRLADGALAHMFPAQLSLKHLTNLRCGDALDIDADAPVAPPPPVWSAADLSRLVSCCPNLRVFADVSLQHGDYVSVLSRLQDLRALHVQYGDNGDVDEFDCEDSLRGLVALTQLSFLHYTDSGEVLEEHLLQLTSLTCQTGLQLHLREWDRGLFFFATRDEARRPVWLQLLEACLESTPDIPAVDILGPKLAEQLFLAEQLRQQLSDKQQQILEQQVIADQAA